MIPYQWILRSKGNFIEGSAKEVASRTGEREIGNRKLEIGIKERIIRPVNNQNKFIQEIID